MPVVISIGLIGVWGLLKLFWTSGGISSGGLDVERALEVADFFGFPPGGTEEGRPSLVFNSLSISDLLATIGTLEA